MTILLAVDLAAKLSAAVQRGAGGEVTLQFDSRGKSPLAFCKEIAQASRSSDIVVVEDVPYGISSQMMIKPVLRLQGALISYLIALGAFESTIFMVPSVWMKDFPGTQHATTKGLSKSASDQERIDTARFHAERLGYTPPDLVADWEHHCSVEGRKALKKDTNVLTKSMTDYVSAFLMSEYARRFSYDELIAMPGVSPASL